MVTDNDNSSIKYFLPGPNADKKACDEITNWLQRELKDVFNGIGCFAGTFSLQAKPDNKPYQAPPRCIAYALQKLQRGIRAFTATRHHHTTRHR